MLTLLYLTCHVLLTVVTMLIVGKHMGLVGKIYPYTPPKKPVWGRPCQGRPYRGGVGGCDTPPFISFVGKICCCRQIQGKGENEKGEERKEGKEKEKRKGKERKEKERKKKGREKKEKKERKKKREKRKRKKIEKKERKRKEKMREDRKGVCHWQVKIVLSANVGL